MMAKRINSCRKGKDGEREVVKILRSYGIEAKRGQQHKGGPDSPDVIHDIPGVHIEVKLDKRWGSWPFIVKAFEQVMNDARGGEPPWNATTRDLPLVAVIGRAPRGQWQVLCWAWVLCKGYRGGCVMSLMRLTDWLEAMGHKRQGNLPRRTSYDTRGLT